MGWAAALAVLAIVGGLVCVDLGRDYRQIETNERDRLLALTRVVDQNIGRQLDGANRALEAVRRDLSLWRGPGSAEAGHRNLRVLADAMPGVRTMLVTDAKGVVLLANRSEIVGLDVSRREYFQAPRRRPDANTLYVSAPFKTVLGVWGIGVTRAIVEPDGAFAGVVSATLDPEYFEIMLRSVRYASDVWSGLAHGDGRLFLFAPAGHGDPGADLTSPDTFLARHLGAGADETVFSGRPLPGAAYGPMAQRTIRPPDLSVDRPLVVTIGRDLAVVAEPWRRDAKVRLGFFGALAAATLAALHLQGRRRREVAALDAARREAERHSEAALRESHAQHRAIADCFPRGAVLLFDRDRRYAVAGGPALEPLVGGTADGVAGRTFAEALGPECPPALRAVHEAALEGRFESAVLERGGHTFELRSAPVSADSGEVRYGLVTAIDVTDRQRLEAQLSISSRMAALGTLTAGVAHELNNPLAYSLSNQAFALEELAALRDDLAELDGPARARAAARVEDVAAALVDSREGGQRVARIVQELRRFAHPGERRERVSLGGVVESALRLCANDVARRARVVKVLRECPEVLGNEAQLVQVVVNLLMNAAEAIPEGRMGEIGIDVGSKGSGGAVVEVRDSGEGIAPELLSRVFDPFFTTKPVGRGTGLGLSISHRIVEAHGGTIGVSSSVGAGTAVRVFLPVVAPGEQVRGPTGRSEPDREVARG